ncbi:hypothetical protein ES319_1Z070600v1 [Gossypium barbadense]|uniref:Uncharacterized protein n=1 Tax=Gossypium barbadense TaxID=3634 RepID=A0A5J5NDT0_GOSBA|nr:hypothetical protein ES319_1Z070600v1 [Gossypium barbadense]
MCLTYIPLLIRKKKERERVRERDGENMFDYLTIWDDYMRYILQVDVKRSMDKGEKRFNQLSIEERGKFDEETLVNVSNIRRLSTTFQKASVFNNEYIVITILVAAEGVHKLPLIKGSGDLAVALQKLASIPTSKILAVEILWTPQNENDTLSERELLEDYPLLRPL